MGTRGRVEVALCVRSERNISIGCVVAAACRTKECAKTIGRVMHAGGEILERKRSLSCIAIWIASVRCRANRLHCGHDPKTRQREHNEKQTAQPRPARQRNYH